MRRVASERARCLLGLCCRGFDNSMQGHLKDGHRILHIRYLKCLFGIHVLWADQKYRQQLMRGSTFGAPLFGNFPRRDAKFRVRFCSLGASVL